MLFVGLYIWGVVVGHFIWGVVVGHFLWCGVVAFAFKYLICDEILGCAPSAISQ